MNRVGAHRPQIHREPGSPVSGTTGRADPRQEQHRVADRTEDLQMQPQVPERPQTPGDAASDNGRLRTPRVARHALGCRVGSRSRLGESRRRVGSSSRLGARRCRVESLSRLGVSRCLRQSRSSGRTQGCATAVRSPRAGRGDSSGPEAGQPTGQANEPRPGGWVGGAGAGCVGQRAQSGCAIVAGRERDLWAGPGSAEHDSAGVARPTATRRLRAGTCRAVKRTRERDRISFAQRVLRLLWRLPVVHRSTWSASRRRRAA